MTDPPGRTRPQPLSRWLRRPEGRLGRLAAETGRLRDWQRALQRALPAEAAGHWQLASLDHRALVLQVDGGEWASRLRYQRGHLLECAASLLGQRPGRLQLRVQPPAARRSRPAGRHLPVEAAASLEAAARATEDPRLREALRRLARRASR